MKRRGGWRHGFGERLGRYSTKFKQAISNRDIIWLHAVSVGEANICVQLIKVLHPRLPNIKLVVSTTTSTAMSELRKKLPAEVGRIYYPIDRRAFVRRALATIRPKAVVLVEAEIWPNFLWGLQARKIPHFLVNTRISDKSYKGYRRFGFLFRRFFAMFTGVGAQSEPDAKRLKELGCKPDGVHVFGSCKFDGTRVSRDRLLDVPSLLRTLGVPGGAPLLIGGSTHAGEEETLARLAKRLREKHPDLFLVLVPRHAERGREVGDDLAKLGERFVYRNEIGGNYPPQEQGSLDCLLVNTTGELKYFYEEATVVFIGKSLTAQGGQNPIEPAGLAKPIVFGPHMGNFAEITAKFLANDAAVQVADEVALESAIDDLLSDKAKREAFGQAAQKVVQSNEGAVERTVDMILSGTKTAEMVQKY
ncbi:MAG: glycosyltransferase N-terminal domain-containing protein [Verrucomicrobiota bacterium]|nr:glycosyltransferase N-terminal domain-containing protein [Verrucomicrobiota bacterium]